MQDKVNKNMIQRINDKHKYRHIEYSSLSVGNGTKEAAVIRKSLRKRQPEGLIQLVDLNQVEGPVWPNDPLYALDIGQVGGEGVQCLCCAGAERSRDRFDLSLSKAIDYWKRNVWRDAGWPQFE